MLERRSVRPVNSSTTSTDVIGDPKLDWLNGRISKDLSQKKEIVKGSKNKTGTWERGRPSKTGTGTWSWHHKLYGSRRFHRVVSFFIIALRGTDPHRLVPKKVGAIGSRLLETEPEMAIAS